MDYLAAYSFMVLLTYFLLGYLDDRPNYLSPIVPALMWPIPWLLFASAAIGWLIIDAVDKTFERVFKKDNSK